MSKYKVAFYIQENPSAHTKRYNQERQQIILNTWAQEKGWKWVKTYHEKTSATESQKEKFQEMILDAKNGLFDGICVVDPERFNTSTTELLIVIDDLLKYEVKVHIHTLQHVDVYGEQGRFILTNFAAFRDFFKGQLATKIRAGVKQKMKQEWFGQAPYGYSIVSDSVGSRKINTRLVKNKKEQEILIQMHTLRSQGKSYSEIATALNIQGVPTRLSRADKASSWHAGTIRNILLRPEVDRNKTE